MNILLINHYAGSPEMGMEFRPYYMAREWVKRGHNVLVIAGDYSHLRRKNPCIEKDFICEKVDGITYCWVKTGQYQGNGIKRALTMLRFTAKLWIKARAFANNFCPDVIITSSTYPIDTYAGQRIKKYAKRALLIHEVHDMWPATLIEIGGMSKYHPFVVLMQKGENSAYRNSDKVVSLLSRAKEHMVQHGMPENNFNYINNGIVLEDWEKPEKLPQEHEEKLIELREKKRFIVGYFGGHALSNALDDLLEVAKKFKGNDKIQFVLVGSGAEKKRLEEKAKKNQLRNVTFLPPVSKYAIPNLVKYFDCSYVGAKDSPLYRFGIAMNKIFDSMMAGKPLLYAVNSPDNYAELYKCGVSVEAGNIEAIKGGIQKLYIMSEEQRKSMGDNGRKAVLENYEYSILAKKFLHIL